MMSNATLMDLKYDEGLLLLNIILCWWWSK